MIPQPLTLEPWTAGDHCPKIGPVVIDWGGVTPPKAMKTVLMRFKQSAIVVELSSDANEITIIAADWTFTVPRQAVAGLTAGEWVFQVKVIAVDDVLDTYIADKVTLLPNV